MASPKKSGDSKKPARPPATTPEGRQKQMMALAFDQAELQMREGVAPAPVVVHFLKLATEQTKLEAEQMRRKNLLLEKQVDQIDQAGRIEELLGKAVESMTKYQGRGEDEEYDRDD